jgi:hypothetical protein
LALVQWLVLRHELPDQHVLDHRITASYGLTQLAQTWRVG